MSMIYFLISLIIWSNGRAGVIISAEAGTASFAQILNGSCINSFDRYDISALDCQTCDPAANKAVSDDGDLCTCADGYKKVQDSGTSDLFQFTCTSCLSSEMAATQDRSRCMFCQNSTSSLDTNSGDCVCRSDNHVLVEKDEAGNWLANKTCVACPTNTKVLSSNPYECAACSHPDAEMGSDGSCTCNSGYTQAGNDWCVLSSDASTILGSYPLATASEIQYSNVIAQFGDSPSSLSVSSYVFEQMFLAAASECTNDRNRTACNALANMCAAAGFVKGHPTCAIPQNVVTTASTNKLNATHNFEEWVDSAPLLFYTADTKNADALNFTVEVESQLRFLLAIYSFNGTYKGFEELDGHLQLCGRNPNELQNWQLIGTSYESNCVADLQKTIEGKDGTDFYSLFVANPSLTTIYPVPIQIDGSDDYVGRFFILDVNSSIATTGASPTLVQWASSIEIDIHVQDGASDLLYPPVLKIKYAQRPLSSIQDGGKGAEAKVYFKVNYTGSYDDLWLAGTVLFSLGVVAVIFIWMVRTYVSWRLDSVAISQLSTGKILRIFVSLVELGSNMLLMVVCMLSTIALVLFKGQTTLFVLLPPNGSQEVQAFYATVLFIFFGYLLGLTIRIWEQLHSDVFFFDWEKPKHYAAADGDEDGRADSKRSSASVSVWRRILVVNKYTELQSSRLISVPYAIFVIIFLLLALRLYNLALNMPSSDLGREGVPIHPFLRFAVVFLAWLIAAGGQLFFRTMCFQKYVVDQSSVLVDLLHSANISCLILDYRYHGFYLHGKSVHTHTDTDLENLSKQISNETRALVRERGLLPGKDTFEIFFHPRFCRHYERIYKRHYRRNLLRTQRIRRDMRRAADAAGSIQNGEGRNEDHASEMRNKTADAKKMSSAEERLTKRLIQVSGNFEKFLKDFILGNHPEFTWQEQRQTFCMKFFGLPPHMQSGFDATYGFSSICGCAEDEYVNDDEDDDGDREMEDNKDNRQTAKSKNTVADNWARGPPMSIFYHDSTNKFNSVFLMGIERQIITFLFLLHAVMDLSFDNTLASVLVVGASNLIIENVRVHFGKDNLSKKTMLHERFFL
mmetsp:Transcript_41209/g.66976  ORF Transcript_41209/g.66976 Transcript_41209/m.66976 type:complete len:1079 (+) Transcript_41209:88-3324(+)